MNDLQSMGAAGRNHSPASEPLTGNGAALKVLQCNWPMWFPRSAETCWSKHLVNSLIGPSSPEKTLHRSWNQKNKARQKLWPSSPHDPVLCSFHVIVRRWVMTWCHNICTVRGSVLSMTTWEIIHITLRHSEHLLCVVGPFPLVFKVTRTSYSSREVRTTSICNQNSYFKPINKHTLWL